VIAAATVTWLTANCIPRIKTPLICGDSLIHMRIIILPILFSWQYCRTEDHKLILKCIMDIAHLSEQNHLDIFGKKCYSYNRSVRYYIWPCCVCKTNTYWSPQCRVNWRVYELTDRSCVRLSVQLAISVGQERLGNWSNCCCVRAEGTAGCWHRRWLLWDTDK